jgi:chromosome segregation ATPase
MGDDATTATFHSTSTTLNSSHATKFVELEASIKANQQEFRNIHSQFEVMENRMLQTMNVCSENTKQMVTMQTQMHSLQASIQSIADQMQNLTQHIVDGEKTPIRSPVKKKHRQQEPDGTDATDTLQFQTKLWDEQPNENSVTTITQNHADQEASQYNDKRATGTAMEE